MMLQQLTNALRPWVTAGCPRLVPYRLLLFGGFLVPLAASAQGGDAKLQEVERLLAEQRHQIELQRTQGAAPVETAEPPADTEESALADEAQAESDLEQEAEDKDEGDNEGEDAGEDEGDDPSPDALRDPVLSKLLKRRLLIDRPGFSMETRGKLQLQYHDADSDDPDNEDDTFVRRLRPFFLGHIGKNWAWKLEVELGADIEAGSIDLEQLDIRDFYLRYEGFESHGWRLTLGNQKAPFSRDFLTSSTHQLLVERTFVGQAAAGVPDRLLGIHVRGEAREGKLAYLASLGTVGHDPGVDRLKFDSLVVGSGNLNQGTLVAGRLDLHPRGAMTFFDSDPHTPQLKHTWSLAGYVWENDGSKNRFTEGGIALDPERADLDSATGLELSGGLRGRGITLDWQYNRIWGETVVPDFTGGVYAGGVTHLDVAAVEGGYRIRGSPVELGGALSRIDADGYSESWDKATLTLNFHGWPRLFGKLQISHSWAASRRGVAGADFQVTRVQVEYGW